jgi:hypothetical protein
MMHPRTINPMICFVRMVSHLLDATLATVSLFPEGPESCIREAFRASVEHRCEPSGHQPSRSPPPKPWRNGKATNGAPGSGEGP